MSDTILDLLVLPAYDVTKLLVADASTYPTPYPIVINPLIEITPPGFDAVSLSFNIQTYNIFTSSSLNLGTTGLPLPDGIYLLKYTIDPSTTYFVNKIVMRVDNLQEEFDEAFMRLDMMQCDNEIKKQAKVDLNTIYFFIQGSIAAANNCATDEANKLYLQASKLLYNFKRNNCGCSSGNNFL